MPLPASEFTTTEGVWFKIKGKILPQVYLFNFFFADIGFGKWRHVSGPYGSYFNVLQHQGIVKLLTWYYPVRKQKNMHLKKAVVKIIFFMIIFFLIEKDRSMKKR